MDAMGGEFDPEDFADMFTAEDFFTFFADNSARHGFRGYGYERPGSEAGASATGSGPFGGSGSNAPKKKKKGGKTADGHVNFPITLEELYKGKVVKLTSKRNILCPTCSGYAY